MDELGALLIRGLGSFGGAVLALVFQPPTTTRDFIIRSVFALLSGLLFGEPIRAEYLKWADTVQHVIGAHALVALASWWVVGAAIRIIGAWKPK
jgi:hypothetical protein